MPRFFLPDNESAEAITRLCAFVVAPGLKSRDVLAELRQRLDPIFLPRPLVFLDSLPRNSTGKLPRSELQVLYAAKVEYGRR
jgi:acyl-coenzyme A synthetase/AMP-(fatty) acid ligase